MPKLEFNLKNNDISRINAKLSSYTEADYRPHSFRVLSLNGVDNISIDFNNKDKNLLKVLPTTDLSWCSGYFPDVIKFIFNHGYQSSSFPLTSFYFNNTNINSGSIILSSDYVSVYLTGQTGNIVNGFNTLRTTSAFTDYANNRYYGVLWSGINNANTYTRESCCDSDLMGSKLFIKKITRLGLPESTIRVEHSKGDVKILDQVIVPFKGGTNTYCLCTSKTTMDIVSLYPGPGDIVESTGSSLFARFGAPVSQLSTGNFINRIGTTKFRSNTYYVPTSIEWFDNNTQLKINPNTACYEEGLHQLRINMSGVFSAYGQFAENNNYYSSYYIKQTSVTTINNSTGGSAEMPVYAKIIDDLEDGTTYIGEADAGSSESDPVWRIKQIVETGPDVKITWADGDTNFDNIWDNRASLSYS